MSSATMVPETGLEPEDAPKRSRALMIVLIVVLLLGLGGGAAWWFLLREAPDVDAARLDGEVVVLEPLTTTLGEATLRHARVTLAVVLAEGESPDIVGTKAAVLQDALLREVAMMDADLLRSSQGSDELRRRLTLDAHEIWGEEVVQRVLLTELLVQ